MQAALPVDASTGSAAREALLRTGVGRGGFEPPKAAPADLQSRERRDLAGRSVARSPVTCAFVTHARPQVRLGTGPARAVRLQSVCSLFAPPSEVGDGAGCDLARPWPGRLRHGLGLAGGGGHTTQGRCPPSSSALRRPGLGDGGQPSGPVHGAWTRPRECLVIDILDQRCWPGGADPADPPW